MHLSSFLSTNPKVLMVSRKLMNSITGKLLYFAKVNLFIRPLLDPLIRLKCLLPDKPYLKHVHFKVSRFGFALLDEFLTVCKLLLPRIKTNKFVKFDWIAPLSMNFMTHVYTDASGQDSFSSTFGIGIFIEDYGAFQIHRSIYNFFLSSTFKKKSDPLHINHQELLAFLLAVWLLVTKYRRSSYRKLVQFRMDNQTCFYNIGKRRFKANFAANHLLLNAGDLLYKNQTRHDLLWIPTEEMAHCVADSLSRTYKETITFKSKLYLVNHLSNDDFGRFMNVFYPPTGMNTALINRIAIPDLDCRDNYFSLYWITVFLSAARSSSSLKKLNTYGNYFELFKQSRGLSGACFDVILNFEERLLLYFAVNLLVISKYIVKTAKTIVYQTIRYESLGTFSYQKSFCTLTDLFKGATKILRRDHKNRIILSPAVLKIYNFTLDWKYNILENCLAGADVLAVGAILRSGEYLYKKKLDPSRRLAQRLVLSKISDASGGNLITTDSTKIVSKISEWLKSKPNYLLLQLEVHKSDFFHRGCELTVCWGTKWFPIWEIILTGVILRHKAGEILTGNSYVFAYHSNTLPIPLSYETVLVFDEARSKRLGLPVDAVKTHDRRRALPSEISCLEDGNELIIRALAR